MTDDLITFEEAGRRAHVSTETVKYWVKTGRLEGVPTHITKKTGKPWRVKVRASDLRSATVDGKLQRLEKELGSKLLTVKEISSLFLMTESQARLMVRLLKPQKHRLFNDQSFFIAYDELIALMQDSINYYEYLAVYDVNQRRLACGCEFCYS